MIDPLHPRTLILLTIGVLLMVLTLRSLRAQRLKERYVLLFLLTGLPFVGLAVYPDAIVFLARVLEIEKPTLLVLVVATYFMLTTFELLSIVSVQERKIDTLGQMIGILTRRPGGERGPEPTERPGPGGGGPVEPKPDEY